MTGEEIVCMILMLVFCVGFGFACLGIGAAAQRSEKPFGFWTHKEVKPEKIRDIPGYNQKNSMMWKRYSIWYFAAAFLQLLNPLHSIFAILAVILVFLACTVGIWLLIKTYQRILKNHEVSREP